jgi:NarL family two-component system response regulator LiaR
VLHPIIARKVISRFRPAADEAGKEKSTIELSEREMEVLKLAARGMSNSDIANELFINIRTVQGHLSSIFNKLSVSSRTEAIFQAVKKGWLSLEHLT